MIVKRKNINWKENHQKYATNWYSWSIWLYENQERRLDSFKKLALYLFAGNLAMLQAFESLTSGVNFRDLDITDLAKLFTCTSGLFCLIVLLPRKVQAIDLSLVRKDWVDFQANRFPEEQPHAIVEFLLQGQADESKENPIQSLSTYSKRISIYVYFSIFFTIFSLIILIINGVNK